jgi:hypothetical protein
MPLYRTRDGWDAFALYDLGDPDTLELLVVLFEYFDSDRDGKISSWTHRKMFEFLGFGVDDNVINAAWHLCGFEDKEQITFDEMLATVEHVINFNRKLPSEMAGSLIASRIVGKERPPSKESGISYSEKLSHEAVGERIKNVFDSVCGSAIPDDEVQLLLNELPNGKPAMEDVDVISNYMSTVLLSNAMLDVTDSVAPKKSPHPSTSP